MRQPYSKTAWLILAAALLAGCGSPGIPRPPSLELPEPVTDLRCVRKGDSVYLAWTIPSETTDDGIVGRLGMTQICRALDLAPTDCRNPAQEIPAAQLVLPSRGGAPSTARTNAQPSEPQKTTAEFADKLPQQFLTNNPAAQVYYAVSVLNRKGRSAGISNAVSAPALISPPAPADFQARLSDKGVVLSWAAAAKISETPEVTRAYRIYRRVDGTKTDAVAGEVAFDDTHEFIDNKFDWEKTYLYRMTIVTTVHPNGKPESRFETDDTAAIKIFAHDIFPPAVPNGLQAVFSGVGQQPFIDLVWTPDIDADLAGYNIYRREAGGEPVKLNTGLLNTSAFRDPSVASGHAYFYSVSAVDVRGNESSRSDEASETVP